MNFHCINTFDENSNNIINIYYYDLDEDKQSYKKVVKGASSTNFNVDLPKVKNKTLYEIEIFNDFYPEDKKIYNFILYSYNDLIDSFSKNPLEINFLLNKQIYEQFTITNIEKEKVYDLLKPVNLPRLEEGTELEKEEIWVDIKCIYCEEKDNFYKLPDGDIYFDLETKLIVDDSNKFKVKGYAFPIEKFNMKIKFYGVGKTLSNIEVSQKYRNAKKLLGQCKEAIFCFQ